MQQAPTFVKKPWGSEEWWAQTDHYVGKILNVNQGHRLSLQYHLKKTESMRVLRGMVTITIGEDEVIMTEGESVHIPPGVLHRIAADRGVDAVVLEVSTPEVNDIVRLQDDYNRTQPPFRT